MAARRFAKAAARVRPPPGALNEAPPCCNGSLPTWYVGGVGSIPTGGSGDMNALVEQPGVLATLSRWRSRVQIPSGALPGEWTVRSGQWREKTNTALPTLHFSLSTLEGTVRKLASRPSSNLG